jgi:replicative DNA helicase Mcm
MVYDDDNDYIEEEFESAVAPTTTATTTTSTKGKKNVVQESGDKLTTEAAKNNLINFDDISDDNLKRLHFSLDINDEVAAAAYFLRDYITTVTIKDPITKKFIKKRSSFYKDIIRLFSQKTIKIIDIDYAHFSDWIDIYSKRVHDICKAYSFDYPIVDQSLLTQQEKIDLHIYMFSKKMQEYLDGDKIEAFQSIMRNAALMVYQSLFDNDLELVLDEKTRNPEQTRAFLNMHIGVKNFPNEHNIYEIKSEFMNRAVVIKGSLVVFDDKTRVEIIKTQWQCGNCGCKFMHTGSSKPKRCLGCDESGIYFSETGQYESINYIYIKIQQHSSPSEPQIGMTEINVKIEGSYLIENFYKRMHQQSASLKITGIVKLSPDIINRNNRNERNLMINALTIEIEGENAIVQYNDKLLDIIANKLNPAHIDKHYAKLQRSMCPHLYGLEPIKTTILLMCVGAVPRVDRVSKHRVRGDINVMIIGDSGLGKSEAGIFILKISPFSIRTVGGKKTTTAAALTTSYENNNGVKQVINGVLPRCDLKGIAIIDELDKRDPEDMQVLSIPMDDNQTIPTHKSGYHHDVPARCPVLLIGNATKRHGKWDPSKTITEQTNYASWLMSRVDLIFVLVDDGDLKRKSEMVEHMAKSRGQMVAESEFIKSYKNKTYSDIAIDKIENDFAHNKFDGIYDTEYIRHEIYYLKQNYRPTIIPGSDVEAKLKKEYLRFSQIKMVTDDGEGEYSQEVMDARSYNGIERVAMAIARCHRHNHVTMEDMDKAINLMMASLTSMLLKPKVGNDKLNDSNLNIYKQMSRLINSPNDIRKALDADDAGWVHQRDQLIKKYRAKLTAFNRTLIKNGFYDCKDCHGKGYISIESPGGLTQSETCITCKGNKVKNIEFTYNDFWLDVDKLHILAKHQIKIWFDIYLRKGMIQRSRGNNFNIGLSNVDSVFLADFVENLAISFAEEDIAKEKERINGGLNSMGV